MENDKPDATREKYIVKGITPSSLSLMTMFMTEDGYRDALHARRCGGATL
jgi:hypothetical protein